jgi:hypothetical protein
MRHALVVSLAMLVASGWCEPASAQGSTPSIVGVWKLTTFVRKEVGSDKVVPPFGEAPAGYRVHTPGGHVFYLFLDRNRKSPAGALTDADRIEQFKTMTAAGGKYEVAGDRLVFHAEVSSSQSMVGRTLTYRYQIAGKTLTMTTDPAKSAGGGADTYFVTTYERVE